MTKNEKILLIAAGGLAFLMLSIPAYKVILNWFLPEWEGFSAVPYWDVSRWSWGYGTQAPGPSGTITKEQALHDAMAVNDNNYKYLSKLITRPLSAGQWAALLSFAYNLGPGNADNLISNINSGNDAALKSQWLQYVYAGGVPNDTLKKRRAAEWELWQS